jgi:hypothetical protein
MQRWIAVSVVAVLLLVGGGAFAYSHHRENREAPIWVPLPINPELSTEKRTQIVKELKEKLSEREILMNVSKDVGLRKKWDLATDDEAAQEVGKRLFVKLGEADTAMGKVPALHIGVTGKQKEQKVLGEIAVRMMDDVSKILGLVPPSSKGT